MTRIKRSTRLAIILSPSVILLTLIAEPLWALYYIIFLGIFSLAKVFYYSLTFNNCEQASNSLKKEIIEAKMGLAKKGFKFATN